MTPTTALRQTLIDNHYRLVECRGKVPTMAGWQKATPTAATVETWRNDTNTGLVLGTQPDGSFLIAIDIDIMDQATSVEVAAMVQDTLGQTSLLRIGRDPKRALLYRLDRPIRKVKVAGAPGFIEVLAGRQQIVCFGIHPDTGLPYTWPTGESPETVDLSSVPLTTVAQLERLLEWLADHLGTSPVGVATPTSTPTPRANGHDYTGPATTSLGGFHLDGREEHMTKLVWAAMVDLRRDSPIPPTTADCETAWGKYLAHTESRLAGSAATLEARLEAEGRGRTEFWTKWAYAKAKWDTDVAAAAAVPKPGADSATARMASVSNKEWGSTESPSDWLARFDVGRWEGKTAPEINFIIEDMMPEGVAVLLAGDGGAGKSILGQLMATCVASGHSFLGKTVTPGSALYLTAEDGEVIAWNRQDKINATLGLAMADLTGKLFIASLADEDFVLFSNGQPTKAEAVLDEALRANGQMKIVIVDSASLVFDDDEIKRKPVSAFMRRLNRLAARHKATVVLIAHTSRSSDGSVAKLASGSTGWVYGSRGAFLLTKQDDGTLKFSLVKPQYSAPFKMALVQNDRFIPVPVESLTGVVASITKKADERRLMEAIVTAWNGGNPLTTAVQSERYLPAYMARKNGMKIQYAKEAMTRMLDANEIVVRRHKSRLQGLCPKELDAWTGKH